MEGKRLMCITWRYELFFLFGTDCDNVTFSITDRLSQKVSEDPPIWIPNILSLKLSETSNSVAIINAKKSDSKTWTLYPILPLWRTNYQRVVQIYQYACMRPLNWQFISMICIHIGIDIYGTTSWFWHIWR